MPTLLEISEQYLSFLAALENSSSEDGEIAPETAQALDLWFAGLERDRDQKLDNYGALIRELELRAEARDEEAKRLSVRVAVDRNLIKNLKERLLLFFDQTKTKKVETRRFCFSVCGNGGKQPLKVTAEPSQLPESCQKVSVEANLDAIRKLLESGVTIDGCTLQERGHYLRIK